MFFACAAIWSSSFLLIKVGIAPEGTVPNEIGRFDPVSLVTMRLTVGALCYLMFIALTRRRVPRDRRTRANLIVAGLFNNALPFVLITWGEKSVDSGLASVLNATTPLFSLIIAHFALSDDRITLGKIFGIIAGFAGVALLATRSLDSGHVNPIQGQVAIVAAAFSYAGAAVFIRKTMRGLDPYVLGAGSLTAAAVMLIGFLGATVRPLPNFGALQPEAFRAVLALGFFNTFIAYILYFNIIKAWGASRSTMVTYLTPPLGIVLGAIFEHEAVDWKLIVGATLIVGGVGLANLWKKPLQWSVAPSAPADVRSG
jgi:drug/metabolite transporter (DMT)-like permease